MTQDHKEREAQIDEAAFNIAWDKTKRFPRNIPALMDFISLYESARATPQVAPAEEPDGCRTAFEKRHWPTMFQDREMMKRMRGKEPYSSSYREWRTAWQLALASITKQQPPAPAHPDRAEVDRIAAIIRPGAFIGTPQQIYMHCNSLRVEVVQEETREIARRVLAALPPTRSDGGLVEARPPEPIDYLKTLEDECWDLRCVEEPTGGDDADIAWHVVGHWMSKPQERVIGYGKTPQEAIKDAMRPRDYEGNLLDEEDTTARVITPWSAREHRPTFQSRVAAWMDACFGPAISADKVERNHRFLEEALELVQAIGCSREEALQLVDYVFGRPVGEPSQEVGGVMVTLAALCLASGLDIDGAAETELARVWTKIDVIRAKQAAKPRGSALPVSPSYETKPVGAV